MNLPASTPLTGRALVLGGGGATGNAWVIGVVAGLFAGGVDTGTADLLVGTSSGATAAAQLATTPAIDLIEAVLAAVAPSPPPPPQPAPAPGPGPGPGQGAGGPVAEHLQAMRALIAASTDVADLRRRLGAAALERLAASEGTWQSRWRATVAARLPGASWPDRPLAITAVDARTGEPVVFDHGSGVELVDAVAASCSSRIPYAIGADLYLDGAFRRNENADLAAGNARVLVLSPLGGRSLHPPSWGTHLAAQVEQLQSEGSRVETVVPDNDSEPLFGENGTDLALRPAAARAGHAQGVALAGRLAGSW